MNKIKFIIIAGSSGGHILPAIKYINILSQIENPDQILFITNEIGSNYLTEIKSNNIKKLVLNSSNKFSYIFNIILNIHIFIYNRKLSIIGFGGFITTPVLLISKLFNIFLLSSNKIYIHEQNIIFGLANKINYLIAKNAFISFPKVNMRKKEIFVGNFFIDNNKSREKLDDNFINILLMGGSAGSLELNNKMLEKLMTLDEGHLNKIKLNIQIPSKYLEKYKKKYINLLNDNRCLFFAFKNNLNIKEYDFILSRSGSGSINEILYFNKNVHFIPHLISRDFHQKLNLKYFISHNMSKENFNIPIKKNLTNEFYFNSLINPYSIEKIICYTTR